MDRLTHLNGNGDIYFLVNGVRVRIDEIEELRVAEKLKYYEDLEEKNKLVVLPCNIGDTVWVVFSNGIRPYVVDRINVISQNQIKVRMRFMVNETLYLTGDNFGQTAFLNEEEAEAALKKRTN